MYQLKLKSMSLAAEARVIKSDEQREKRLIAKWKARAIAGRAKAAARGAIVDPNPPQASSASLTGAYLHRVNQVRKEARCALLAYGFLKGNSYRSMENFSWTQPNWDRVEKLAIRYGGVTEQEIKQSFASWMNDALEGIPSRFSDSVQPGSMRRSGGNRNPQSKTYNGDWIRMQEARNGPRAPLPPKKPVYWDASTRTLYYPLDLI